MHRARSIWIRVLLLLGFLGGNAEATQHLVNPGADWSDTVQRCRPGDEVVLLPGTSPHRPGSIEKVHGEPDRPITIRGAAPDRPAIIQAENWGLLLRQASNVVIQDVVIHGARIAGVDLSPQECESVGAAARRHEGERAPETLSGIVLRRVVIMRTAAEPGRNAIRAVGVKGLTLDRCRIDGWGGAAVQLAGCTSVDIASCRFGAIQQDAQEQTISIGKGSADVCIRRCRFEPGLRVGIALGADGEGQAPATGSGLTETSAGDTPPTSVRSVRIEDSLFNRVEQPLVIGDVNGLDVTCCTFLDPRQSFVRFDAPQGRAAWASGVTFANNLFTWQLNGTRALVLVPAASAAAAAAGRPDPLAGAVLWNENLWWSAEHAVEAPEKLPLPGREGFPQLVDVDPNLDGALMPSSEAARSFGVRPTPSAAP